MNPALFRAMLDNINQPVFLVAAGGTVLYANPAAIALSGIPEEELLHTPCHTLFAGTDQPCGGDCRFSGGISSATNCSITRVHFGNDTLSRYRLKKCPVILDDKVEGVLIQVEGSLGNPAETTCTTTLAELTLEQDKRTLVEQELREKLDLLEAVVEESHSPVVILREGILYASPAVADITGRPLEQLLSMRFTSLMQGRMREIGNMMIHKILNGKRNRFRFRRVPILRPDGVTRWIQGTAARVSFAGDAAVAVHFMDVTSQVESRIALEESENLLRTLVEAVPDIVLFKDGDGRWLQANHAALTAFHLEGIEYYGMTGLMLAQKHHLPTLPFMDDETSDALTWRHGFPQRFETPLPGITGVHRIFDTIKIPLFHKDGTRQGIVTLARDITVQKRNLDILKESEKKFREMFENHSAVMLLLDPTTGAILEANRAACKYYGFGTSYTGGQLLSRLVVPDSADITFAETSFFLGKNRYTTRHRLGTGDIRYVEVHSSPITVGKVSVLFAIVQDITERVRFELKLKDLNRDLERRTQKEIAARRQQEQMLIQQSKMAAMGEMLGAIAHQWRQPLSVMGLLVQNLEDDYTYGTVDADYIRHLVDESMEQVDFMSRTIEDFKNFFKPSRQKETFDVKQSVREVLHLFSAQLKSNLIIASLTCGGGMQCPSARADKQIAENVIEVYTCEACPFVSHGYPNEFKQVILNLVSNAKDAILEARSRGDIPHDASGNILIGFFINSDTVTVTVEDNGGGIPDEIGARIFEPYFTTKEQGKGTGIGLYMSKMIIENNMGGVLDFENTALGARFRIQMTRSAEKPKTELILE